MLSLFVCMEKQVALQEQRGSVKSQGLRMLTLLLESAHVEASGTLSTKHRHCE